MLRYKQERKIVQALQCSSYSPPITCVSHARDLSILLLHMYARSAALAIAKLSISAAHPPPAPCKTFQA